MTTTVVYIYLATCLIYCIIDYYIKQEHRIGDRYLPVLRVVRISSAQNPKAVSLALSLLPGPFSARDRFKRQIRSAAIIEETEETQ